jgi:hypothetical protein
MASDIKIYIKMKPQYRKREKTELQFSKSIINKNISLPITLVGKNISEIIEKYLKGEIRGDDRKNLEKRMLDANLLNVKP